MKEPNQRHSAPDELALDNEVHIHRGALVMNPAVAFGGRRSSFTSGDLPFVPESGFGVERFTLTGRRGALALTVRLLTSFYFPWRA